MKLSPPPSRTLATSRSASRASFLLKCCKTLYENTVEKLPLRKGRCRASPTTYFAAIPSRVQVRRAASTAPSEGSIPTTSYPLRAAAMHHRPQLHPRSRKDFPCPSGRRNSGIGMLSRFPSRCLYRCPLVAPIRYCTTGSTADEIPLARSFRISCRSASLQPSVST